MRIRIHRGAAEIGGNCIEVAADDGSRLVLDVGRPLSAGWDDDVPLPAVRGFDDPDPSLLGVVISHPHLDHYGLVAGIPDEVPVYVGREAARILDAAALRVSSVNADQAVHWDTGARSRDSRSNRAAGFHRTLRTAGCNRYLTPTTAR